jgi:hypothetical protein
VGRQSPHGLEGRVEDQTVVSAPVHLKCILCDLESQDDPDGGYPVRHDSEVSLIHYGILARISKRR